MTLYRRKPGQPVAAMQYIGDGENLSIYNGAVCNNGCYGHTWPHIHTMHDGQIVELTPSDWILPEPDGIHFYPVKDSVFKVTYEEVT